MDKCRMKRNLLMLIAVFIMAALMIPVSVSAAGTVSVSIGGPRATSCATPREHFYYICSRRVRQVLNLGMYAVCNFKRHAKAPADGQKRV